MEPLSFQYENGSPCEIVIGRYVGGDPRPPVHESTPISCSARRHEVSFMPVGGDVFVYCSFAPIKLNPAPYEENQPTAFQIVTLGNTVDGDFLPVIRFGIVDDDRASMNGQANYVPGAYVGKIEYFGMFARPGTAYDFKIKLDLVAGSATAWVAGRGDDEWFPLIVDAPLEYTALIRSRNRMCFIDTAQVDQLPGATGIENLVVSTEQWLERERLRPNPLGKTNRTVRPDGGFKFRPMKSLWRDASRHVTVARDPNAEVGWWLGFPDIVQTGPSELVCIHNDGPGHGGTERLWAVHSVDLGNTWGDPALVWPGPTNCPRIQRLRDGSLLALADKHGLPYPVFFFRSTDGGHKWEQAGLLDSVAAGGHESCVPSRVVELPDDSWLMAASHTPGKARQVVDGEQLEFYRSTDRGVTWQLWSTLKPPFPLSICEPSIIPLQDGRLMVVARESGGSIPGVRTFSTDNGRTWSPPEELPFYIQGRTCGALLNDGRVMVTFRHGTSLWAWVGGVDDALQPVVQGTHINDRQTVGIKDGELFIDSDGKCGQFTRYLFCPPDSDVSRIEVTAEVKVLHSDGLAATISVPFVGNLRIFPDKIQIAHKQSLRVAVTPGVFHTYRVVLDSGSVSIYVDGELALATDQLQSQVCTMAWSALKLSPYPLAFGNEPAEDASAGFDWVPDVVDATKDETQTEPPGPVFAKNITPAVTGCSVWKRFEARYDDPRTGKRQVSWNAESGEFPDQYQLDRIIEIDGTISGADQGYSGWVELGDGRILVLNYTDDTARWNCDASYPPLGAAWIRGTFLLPSDLPG